MESENEKTKDQSVAEVKPEEVEMSPQNENEDVSPDQVALTEDSSKVTFIPASDTSQNGEAKVQLPEAGPQYSGMSKEELMQYVNDPFWIRIRWVMFVLFWLIWVGMLAGAIVIIIFAPKCAPPPTTEWYQESPIYEVYTRSFKDSDDSSPDGLAKGDLGGIESKLGYFEEIGIKTLWLPSIFKSSTNSPDAVIDLQAIHPDFGTMDDFKSLIAAMKEKDMKLILDFVPNHSSEESSWFQKSAARDPKYEDYYVWKGGPNAVDIPNNWRSVDGGPAWKFHAGRGQFYLHQFSSNSDDITKPDFNLTNTAVVEDLEKAMTFWLKEGVAGFRMTGVNYLFEDYSNFTMGGSGEAVVPCTGNQAEDYACLAHTKTVNQPTNFKLLKRWRKLLQHYTNTTDQPRVLIVQTVSSGSDSASAEYYGTEDDKVADLQYNTEFIQDVTQAPNIGVLVQKSVCKWIDNMPNWSLFAWAFGNADSSRVASRLGTGIVDALHMISLILPGTPFTYYGDELGVTDYSSGGVKEDGNRMRTPMPWDDSQFAGFSNYTPWKAVNPDYTTVNTVAQLGSDHSHLAVYRKLVTLRNEQQSVKFGETKVSALTNTTLAFTRSMKGSPAYAVVVNFDSEDTKVDLSSLEIVPKDARVILKSGNTEIKQKTVDTTGVAIAGYEGIVLSFVAQSKP